VADGSHDRLLEALVVALGAGNGANAVAAGAKDARRRPLPRTPLLERARARPGWLTGIPVLGVARGAGNEATGRGCGAGAGQVLVVLAVLGGVMDAGAVGWGEVGAGHAVLGDGLRALVRGDGADGLGLAVVADSLVAKGSLCRLGRTHLPPVPSLLVHGCGPLLCLVLVIDTRQAAQLLQQVPVACAVRLGRRSRTLRDCVSVWCGASHAWFARPKWTVGEV